MATPEQVQQQINQALAEERERVAAERTARAAAVSVKLPQFWPEKTRFWFARAESEFEIRGITVQKTMFSHVVSMLDDKTAKQAMDIIEEPPALNPYTALKERLTKAFALSDDEKADRLLDWNGLGDKTPSQCLASMLQLVPNSQDPGFLFRQIFLRQLPQEVRTQLAQTTKTGTTAKDLRELAAEADKYFETAGSRISAISSATTVQAAGSSSQRWTSTPESHDWEDHNVFETDAEVFAVSRGGRGVQAQNGHFRGTRGSQPGGRGKRNRLGNTPSIIVCPYHLKYGDEALNCSGSPCEFKNKASGNSQPGRRLAN